MQDDANHEYVTPKQRQQSPVTYILKRLLRPFQKI